MAGLVFFLSTDPGGDFCGDVGGVFTPLPRASDGVEGGVSTTTVWRYAAETAGGRGGWGGGGGGGGHNLRAQVPWKGEVAMRRDLYSHYLRALGGRELLPSHGFVYPTWFVRVYPLISKCGRHGGSLQRAEHEFHETAAWLVSCSPACPHPRTPRWSGAPALGKSPHCFAGTEFSSSILSSILSGLRLREDEFTKMR